MGQSRNNVCVRFTTVFFTDVNPARGDARARGQRQPDTPVKVSQKSDAMSVVSGHEESIISPTYLPAGRNFSFFSFSRAFSGFLYSATREKNKTTYRFQKWIFS